MGVPIQLVDIGQPFAWEIPALLDAEACARLVAAASDWVPGTVNGREGRVVRPELRDADVCVLRDPELARWLDARVSAHLPAAMCGDPLVGVGAPLRIYRYRPGQFFGRHRDQKYQRGPDISHLALLVYLDAPTEGGDTVFFEQELRVRPRPGHAVLFQNAALHAGEPVIRGEKHVLRADVMYRRGTEE